MAVIYANLQGGTVSDNPLAIGATTVNSAAFADLPEVVAPDVMYLTLDPTGVDGEPEIVQVTAHTSAATSATIVRASQSTTARAHNSGTIWVNAVTKADLDEFLKTVDTANLEDDAVTGAKIADDSIDSQHYVDGSIDTAHLADDAVTTDKITDANVTYDKLGIARFRATATGFTIPGASTPIDLDTEVTDPDGWHSGTGSALTAPATGVYLFVVEVVEATGSTTSVVLQKNSGTKRIIALTSSDTANYYGSAVVALTAAEVVEVAAAGASTVNADVRIFRLA